MFLLLANAILNSMFSKHVLSCLLLLHIFAFSAARISLMAVLCGSAWLGITKYIFDGSKAVSAIIGPHPFCFMFFTLAMAWRKGLDAVVVASCCYKEVGWPVVSAALAFHINS